MVLSVVFFAKKKILLFSPGWTLISFVRGKNSHGMPLWFTATNCTFTVRVKSAGSDVSALTDDNNPVFAAVEFNPVFLQIRLYNGTIAKQKANITTIAIPPITIIFRCEF